MDILLLFPGFIGALIIIFCYECKIRRTEPMNKVHFYVARDSYGLLFLYMGKPIRGTNEFLPSHYGRIINKARHFSKYGLNENDYAYLKWEDKPVEVFINMKD